MKFHLTVCAMLLIGAPSAVPSQEMPPEEIVSRHLNAIGSAEARSSLKNVTAIGLSEFEAKSPSVKGGGRAVIASDRRNLLFAMSFNSHSYPFEKIGYFRSDVSVPRLASGQRTVLGLFLIEHNSILSEGLFAGIFSMRWPLLDHPGVKGRLKSAGKRKIEGKEAYILSYHTTGIGSDEFSVRLYFDKDTFRHIRSEYRREVPGGRIVFGRANQIAASTLALTESFGDFRNVEGLTLPFLYKAHFVSNSGATLENFWSIRVSDYRFDQQFESDFFSFDAIQRKP